MVGTVPDLYLIKPFQNIFQIFYIKTNILGLVAPSVQSQLCDWKKNRKKFTSLLTFQNTASQYAIDENQWSEKQSKSINNLIIYACC